MEERSAHLLCLYTENNIGSYAAHYSLCVGYISAPNTLTQTEYIIRFGVDVSANRFKSIQCMNASDFEPQFDGTTSFYVLFVICQLILSLLLGK